MLSVEEKMNVAIIIAFLFAPESMQRSFHTKAPQLHTASKFLAKTSRSHVQRAGVDDAHGSLPALNNSAHT